VHAFGLGEHGDVAAVELVGGCAHALRKEALQIGMHGLVFLTESCVRSGRSERAVILLAPWSHFGGHILHGEVHKRSHPYRKDSFAPIDHVHWKFVRGPVWQDSNESP
jgi:hypothetical protein